MDYDFQKILHNCDANSSSSNCGIGIADYVQIKLCMPTSGTHLCNSVNRLVTGLVVNTSI
jgi:hypothetical protein